MVTKEDILNLAKEEPSKPIFSKHAIKMNYPIEMREGYRTCGKCGSWNPNSDYIRKKPGYDWRCKSCRSSDE